MKYIDKDAVVAEIERIKKEECPITTYEGRIKLFYFERFLSFLDTLEVKEEVECKRPEYSYFDTTYQRGKKHCWNAGDILAYYYYSSDCEGEHIVGQIINVEIDEEQDDWFYTFENGRIYYEEELLKNDTYVKKK